MARVFLVYDTKYGNTKLVAEKITEGIGEVERARGRWFWTKSV